MFSDHRPVYATFDCRVSLIDELHRNAISQELYDRRKAEVGDSAAHADGEDTEDEDLIGYDAIEPGLPPASSDRQKWWLDNRQPARAQIPIPNGRDGQPMALNPHRPSNPFGHGEELDWISVSRSSPGASLSSISSSPYEKLTPPRGMSSAGPRKLPPQYDPTTLPAQVGRMKIGDGDGARSVHGDRSSAAPPPPPPRRSATTLDTGSSAAGLGRSTSTVGIIGGADAPGKIGGAAQPLWTSSSRPTSVASQTSQLSQQLRAGKPAPPVAKKPAHLLSTSPASTSSLPSTLASGNYSDGDFQPPLPARASTMGVKQDNAQWQPPTVGGSGTGRKPVAPPKPVINMNTNARANATATGGPPMLPKRSRQVNQGPVDLLEGGEEEMGGWETLQPSAA